MRERAVTATFAMFTWSLHVEMTGRFDWRGMNLGQGGRGWICASGYGCNSIWIWCWWVPIKSLVDGIGTLNKEGLVVKTTEVGDYIWDLDISRWGDVAIMDVGRVVIMGVEDKLTGESLARWLLIRNHFSVWSLGKSFLKCSWTQEWHENSLDDLRIVE